MTDLEAIIDGLALQRWKWESETLMSLGDPDIVNGLISVLSDIYFYPHGIEIFVFRREEVPETEQIAKKYGLWDDHTFVSVGWEDLERVTKMMQELDSSPVIWP